jgi:hypothetical protein
MGTKTVRTSSIMSHRRPGVATSTSTPRSKMRRCFCADMPPTIAATLTNGGARASGFFSTLPLLFFGFAASSAGSTALRHALRCDETCSASSRVGANINAPSWRFTLENGRAQERSRWRMGSPYARVLPEPFRRMLEDWHIWATAGSYGLCNANKITVRHGERDGGRLNRCW